MDLLPNNPAKKNLGASLFTFAYVPKGGRQTDARLGHGVVT
ncbi:hypothetical protein HMPREF0083_06100, partial [Aneurinibacillus aneurinilyticus ATCC 12856]